MACFLKFPVIITFLKFFKKFCCPYPTQFWFLSHSFLLVWVWSWKVALASQFWEFLGLYHSSPFRNSYTGPLYSPAAGVGKALPVFCYCPYINLLYFPVNTYWLHCGSCFQAFCVVCFLTICFLSHRYRQHSNPWILVVCHYLLYLRVLIYILDISSQPVLL